MNWYVDAQSNAQLLLFLITKEQREIEMKRQQI